MKTKDFLKEVWKQNKWGYFYSCIALSIGCLLHFAKFKTPLHITLPLAFSMAFIMMYCFAFMIGDKD